MHGWTDRLTTLSIMPLLCPGRTEDRRAFDDLDSNRLTAERAAADASRRFKASTPKRLSGEASTGFMGRAAKAEIVSGGILAMPCMEV